MNPWQPQLTKQGHGEALHHAARPSQGEVALGVVDNREHASSQSRAQVGHRHVHQSVVEWLPQLLVHQGHNDHCGVEDDGRPGEEGHDDG